MGNTAADVRGVLKTQGAPTAAIDAADTLEAAKEQIRAMQFRTERETAEVAKASVACVDAFREAIANADFEIDARLAQTLDRVDAETTTRAREGRKLSDVVDVQQLRTSDDVAEIVRLVDDAEREGVGAEARAIAAKRLRVLAADEQKRHVIGTAGSAFSAWTSLSSQRSTSASSDRRAIEDRAAAEKRRVRELVTEVARTVGLAAALKVAATTAAVSAPDASSRPSKFSIGKFFDQFPQVR